MIPPSSIANFTWIATTWHQRSGHIIFLIKQSVPMWLWKCATPEATGKTESFPFISTMKKKTRIGGIHRYYCSPFLDTSKNHLIGLNLCAIFPWNTMYVMYVYNNLIYPLNIPVYSNYCSLLPKYLTPIHNIPKNIPNNINIYPSYIV